MNTRVPPFTSGRVRAAIATALNRRAFAGTSGTPAATILPPVVDGYDASAPVPGPDVKAARAALGGGGLPNGFSTQLVVGNLGVDQSQARSIARDLARAGVRVAIIVLPVATAYEDRYEMPGARTPMGIATWCTDWPGLAGRSALAPLVDGRAIAARGSTNYSALNDVALERLIDRASAASDPTAAAAAWTEADRRATSQAAVVPLAYPGATSPLGPGVRGFVAHPFFTGGDLTALWLVR
jgi:ABC-type transport system substrate-binding protein